MTQNGGNRVHVNFRLNPGRDDQLIDAIVPYMEERNASQLIRTALYIILDITPEDQFDKLVVQSFIDQIKSRDRQQP
jgi:hypothetical protein